MARFRWSKDNGVTWNVVTADTPYNLAGVLSADTVLVEPLGDTVTIAGVPVPNIAAFLGHSFVFATVDTNAGLSRAVRGWPNFVSFFSRGKLLVPQANIFGYSGADQATILSHVAAARATLPTGGFLFYDTLANEYTKDDANRRPVASVVDELAACFAIDRTLGIIPVVKLGQNRIVSGVTPLSTAQEQWRQDVNAALRALASVGNLLLIDEAELFGDLSDTNITYDKVHAEAAGSRKLGLDGWNAISKYVTASAPDLSSVVGNVLANPTFTGSGGTKSPNDGSITGNVPNSWTLQVTGTPSVSSIADVIATDGGPNWKEVTLTGAGVAAAFSFFQTGSAGGWGSGFVIGDDISGGYDVEVEGDAGAIGQYVCEIRTFGGSTPRSGMFTAVNFAQVLNPSDAVIDKGRFELYKYTLPASYKEGAGFYINGTVRPGKTMKFRFRTPWVKKG